jgi:hypothetical protein
VSYFLKLNLHIFCVCKFRPFVLADRNILDIYLVNKEVEQRTFFVGNKSPKHGLIPSVLLRTIKPSLLGTSQKPGAAMTLFYSFLSY